MNPKEPGPQIAAAPIRKYGRQSLPYFGGRNAASVKKRRGPLPGAPIWKYWKRSFLYFEKGAASTPALKKKGAPFRDFFERAGHMYRVRMKSRTVPDKMGGRTYDVRNL